MFFTHRARISPRCLAARRRRDDQYAACCRVVGYSQLCHTYTRTALQEKNCPKSGTIFSSDSLLNQVSRGVKNGKGIGVRVNSNIREGGGVKRGQY